MNCVSNPFNTNCLSSRYNGRGQKTYIPRVFTHGNYKSYGHLLATGQLQSVLIDGASVRRKSGNNVRIAIQLRLDGQSKYSSQGGNHLIDLQAPNKDYSTNIAYQCSAKAPYTSFRRYSSNKNKRENGQDYYYLAFNTTRPPDASCRDKFNTSSFPSPMEIVVTSNGYPTAHIKCDTSRTGPCTWTYPSIFKRERTTEQIGLPGTSYNYKKAAHESWTKSFWDAEVIKAQPLETSNKRARLTLAKQAYFVIADICQNIGPRLNSLPPGLDKTQLMILADNCLRKNAHNRNIRAGDITATLLWNTPGYNDYRSVCSLLSIYTKQSISQALTRNGLTRSEECHDY